MTDPTLKLVELIRLERHEAQWSEQTRALFASFVVLHHRDVVNLCERKAGRSAPADELAQDTWMVAWRRLHTFENTASLRSWVLGIARNICSNARTKRREYLTEFGLLEHADEARDVLRSLTAEERAELLRDACATLPREEQDAIFLRYMYGKSYAEIESLLCLTQTSGARAVLQRTRRHLEQRLRARLEELNLNSSFFRSILL